MTEEHTYQQLTRRLIPFFMLCYVIAYLDRINVGFAKLQMCADLGFSETAYGLAAGIFFLGYVLFPVPSNLLMYRIGARRWIGCLMIVWGLVSGSMALVKTPAQFLALRFLLGAAESGFYPGIILYLTQWFPNHRRAHTVSLFQSAIALAGIVGGPLSGFILDSLHLYGHLRGWQWLFLIEAVPAVMAGIMALCYLDNSIAEARWLTSDQKSLLMRNLIQDDAAKVGVSVRGVFADLRVWGLGVVVFGLAMGIYAISFWMPTLLHESSTRSNTEIGWLTAIPNLIAAAGMVVIARNSDARRERRLHVVVPTLLGAVGLLGSVLFAHNLVLVLVFLSLGALGVMSALPVQWSFLTAFLGGSSAAAAIGVVNSVGNLGGIVSPALIGWLKDQTRSLDAGMYAIAGFVVISALVALSYPARLVNR
jgi:D-galactonate transporter